ncbi:MAG: PTS sugar transporter subunit IIA [Acidobacteria bacterium]|nr:PTS sugar transporter subunit IIA [Acidobacteriota bacterium]MCZ6769862.1 PTS sugar transporter subunit IIA [Acidobacteriota bacterium]MCZ6879074.1 PTS sugar transporter subunit IIA [Acidobacteriota bacterium]
MTQDLLVGAVLVTHGRLGQEFVAVAQTIVGELSHIVAVSIGLNDDVEESKKRIEEAVQKVNQGKGVIILTDMFGGTPSNLSLPLLQRNEVEIITGVNLPMVIKLVNQSGNDSLLELVTKVTEQGRKHISISSELLGE